MAVLLAGAALGGLAHLSSQAMKAPVPTQNLQYFDQPLNMRANLAMANPGMAPTQSYVTSAMAEPEYTPKGRDQNSLFGQISLNLSSQQTYYQDAMRKFMMNAGDNVVLPNANELSVILTNDHETYSQAYVGRNNGNSANASARMAKGAPLPGTLMGAANWAQ